jgi:hypothetical protein
VLISTSADFDYRPLKKDSAVWLAYSKNKNVCWYNDGSKANCLNVFVVQLFVTACHIRCFLVVTFIIGGASGLSLQHNKENVSTRGVCSFLEYLGSRLNSSRGDTA